MKNTESEQIDFMLRSITLHDDEVAFRYLFEHYYPSLCLFAKRFIDDRETREDIVQEVFFRLWDKRKQITVMSSAQNYLLTSVRNLCLNYLRRQETQQSFEKSLFDQPEDEEGDRLIQLRELEELLAQTLALMPPEYRLAFELNRMEGKSLDEVAQQMGVSTRTVERYRDKALALLHTELKDYLPLFLFLFAVK
ncbi:MAG: RNA polymerase sigma-70 factor [Parabacteroides sp.]|nr:RNA polymerase sigma-70 factor [Parabacteroides sp.]